MSAYVRALLMEAADALIDIDGGRPLASSYRRLSASLLAAAREPAPAPGSPAVANLPRGTSQDSRAAGAIEEAIAVCRRYDTPAVNAGAHALARKIRRILGDAE